MKHDDQSILGEDAEGMADGDAAPPILAGQFDLVREPRVRLERAGFDIGSEIVSDLPPQ